MKRPRSIFKTVIAPIVAAIAVVPTLLIAAWETLHGRGAASYSNVYGLTSPYVSVLIMVFVLAVVLAVAYLARLAYFWCNDRDRNARLHKINSPTSSNNSTEVK
jgi:uncharacterized membrane protein